MASITASGYLHGRYCSVTWNEPGVLTSEDAGLCELFRFCIEELEGVYIGPPTGGGRVYGQMGWPAPFMQVAREVLAGCVFSGDLLDNAPTETIPPGIIE